MSPRFKPGSAAHKQTMMVERNSGAFLVVLFVIRCYYPTVSFAPALGLVTPSLPASGFTNDSPSSIVSPAHTVQPRCHRRDRRLQLAASSSNEPNWESNNPWSILGIPSGSSKADIKKAYKRLAMRYHPDVVVSPDEKKAASDKFSKINMAYQAALEMERSGTTTSSGSTTGGSSWEPPHRRAAKSRPSSYTSSSRSTDWRDYMPDYYNNEDAQYDTNGDTFGKIFSDLFREAGGGGVGVVSDFVDFFESNFAYGTSSSSSSVDDPELRELLQTGTVGDVGDAMDETELVVQQLQTKRQNSANELMQLQADRISGGMSYSEQMQMQERIDGLEAQQKVVDGYIEKARKRLLSLQTRYKDLIVNGKQDDRKARSSWDEIRNEASSSRRTATRSEPAASPNKEPASSSPSESWKSEGFGSYGRGRGSSRRRRRQQNTSTNASSSESTRSSSYSRPRDNDPPKRTQNYETASSRRTSDRSSTGTTPSYATPPHRRAGSSYAQKLEDQRRLREIKVEEEFDQLKKDLGL